MERRTTSLQRLDSAVMERGPSVEASTDTEAESKTTRKLIRYSCNGVLCVARQRLVTKFAAVAWRHSLMLTSCQWPPVQSIHVV